jgi:hypothetical protein
LSFSKTKTNKPKKDRNTENSVCLAFLFGVLALAKLLFFSQNEYKNINMQKIKEMKE